MKRIIVASVVAVGCLGASLGVASAGEITGNGTSLHPLHANSECAFSGLDDADADGFVHTQNWGQLGTDGRAFLGSIGVTPAAMCNGHLNPMRD